MAHTLVGCSAPGDLGRPSVSVWFCKMCLGQQRVPITARAGGAGASPPEGPGMRALVLTVLLGKSHHSSPSASVLMACPLGAACDAAEWTYGNPVSFPIHLSCPVTTCPVLPCNPCTRVSLNRGVEHELSPILGPVQNQILYSRGSSCVGTLRNSVSKSPHAHGTP